MTEPNTDPLKFRGKEGSVTHNLICSICFYRSHHPLQCLWPLGIVLHCTTLCASVSFFNSVTFVSFLSVYYLWNHPALGGRSKFFSAQNKRRPLMSFFSSPSRPASVKSHSHASSCFSVPQQRFESLPKKVIASPDIASGGRIRGSCYWLKVPSPGSS